MKLCLITFEYAGVTHSHTGGIGNWIANLAPALAKYGHDVNVLSSDPETSGVVVTPDGVNIHRRRRIPAGNGASVDIANGLIWPRYVKKWLHAQASTDVVIAPEYGGAAASFAASSRDTTFVTQLHAASGQLRAHSNHRRIRTRSAIPSWMTQCREVRQLSHSDAVLGCSTTALKDTLNSLDIQPRFTGVMPNLVDLAALRTLASKPTPSILPSGRYVLFFGRLEQIKGVHILAQAMRTVLRVHPDVKLILAGSDRKWHGSSMIEHVRQTVGNAANRVVFLDELPPTDLMPLIAASDVVVLPSLSEGFCFAVLETMALGRPLVTTSGHGADDMVTDGRDALVVPPGCEQPLSVAIDRLLKDRQLARRLGVSAALRAERYDHHRGAVLATEILTHVQEQRTAAG